MQTAEKLRLLEELKTHRGFLYLNELVQQQVDALQQSILFTRCTSVDSALGQEYSKGSVEGRLAWAALLEAEITNLEIDLKRQQVKEDDRTNEHTSPSGFDAD